LANNILPKPRKVGSPDSVNTNGPNDLVLPHAQARKLSQRVEQSQLDKFITETEKKSSIPGLMIGGSLPSTCSVEVQNKLAISLDCLIDYFVLYGFEPLGFDRQSTLTHWQICSAECGWIKFLKYKLSAFMSHFLDGELPDKPFKAPDAPQQIAGGSLGRFIRLLMTGPQSSEIAVGILYMKKGFPRPEESALQQALLDTKKVLTEKKPVPHCPFISFQGSLEEIDRTVGEIFHFNRFTPEVLDHPYTASIKSNFVDTRKEFGTYGTLIDLGLIKDAAPNLSEDSTSDIFASALVRRTQEEMIEDEDSQHFIVNPEFRTRVNELYRGAYTVCRERAMQEQADVKLVALPEALKVRVISKGPPLTYFVLKPIQKFLHRIMRKQRCFALIGRPVDETFLTDVFSKETGLFHSLDYKSATDLLNPEVSRRVVDGICNTVGLPDDIRTLFHKALTGHLVEGVPQEWGQLMGSIVSFIVLCIVNASVIRTSLEISTHVRRNLSDLPMVVNGDDGLVRAPADFLNVWKSCAALVGLMPSVGKVYTHESYCNINSTSYLYENNKFNLVPYVNMGLAKGLTRSGGPIGRKDVFNNQDGATLGAKHHSLMDSCPRHLMLAVHELFLKENARTLKSLRLPWYIPESLGGVGLQPIIEHHYGLHGDIDDFKRRYVVTRSGHKCGPSRLDVRIARSFKDRVHREFSVGRIPTAQPIQARTIWQKQINRFVNLKHVQLEDSDKAFLDLSTFYLTPSLVTKQISSSVAQERLRSNERAWTYITGLFEDPPLGEDLFLD
jgi:hypothetical protein